MLANVFRQNVTIDQNRITDYLFENLSFLLQMAPEATLRQILRKRYLFSMGLVFVVCKKLKQKITCLLRRIVNCKLDQLLTKHLQLLVNQT